MRLILPILSLVFMSLLSRVALDHQDCTYYADNSAVVDGNGSLASPFNTLAGHLSLQPGETLCLRGTTSGTSQVYPISTRLTLAGDGTPDARLALQAYPGEQVEIRQLVSTGGVLRILGDYWTVSHLILDNGDTGTGSQPAVDIEADFFTLQDSEVRHGHYNGIELHGNDTSLLGNHIHHFDRVTVDAHCMIIFPNSHRALIADNLAHDCSGDQIHIYWPGSVTPVDPAQMSQGVVISGNTFYRGTLVRSEQAIDIKQGQGLLITGNDLSGYEPAYGAINMLKLSRDTVIENNLIHDTGRGLTSSRDVGQNSEGLIVRNNILRNISTTGLYLAGATAPTFDGNYLENIGQYSLRLVAFGATNLTFRNNTVVNSGPVRQDAGAVLSGVTVQNNQWINADCGVLCEPATPTPTSTPPPTATLTPSPTPTLTPSPAATYQCLRLSDGLLCLIPYTPGVP